MINRNILRLVLIAVLISSFHGLSFLYQAQNSQAARVPDVVKAYPSGLAFADEGKGSDSHDSEDNQNSSPQDGKQSPDDNRSQFQESDQTAVERHSESENSTQPQHNTEDQTISGQENRTEHEVKNYNMTEPDHHAKTESDKEIENENNNLNATYHPTEQDLSDIEDAKVNQTIAAQVDIGAGNVSARSIDDNVVLKVENTTNDAVNMTVSASSQSGPKVILINLNSTTIDVGNVKYLHIMYDGQPIAPASSVSDVLHPSSSDQPHFAILVTQSGAQILISIPHFSTHTITITSLSQVISPVPEFGPIAALILAIAIISIIAVSTKTGLRIIPRT